MVKILEYPTEADWLACKSRALVTVGLNPKTPPTDQWKHTMLEARHSPIRRLRFSFYIECPSYVATHLARHIHAQPYIQSQRNDRQDKYDRCAARQDAPVRMIWDINAEELMVVANKRLCSQADPETRRLVTTICNAAIYYCPEFEPFLVPMCEYHGGVCHEINPCGRVSSHG